MKNILVMEDTLIPIDFMDMNYSWRINDVAIVLFHLVFTDGRDDLIESFLGGYAQTLTSFEREALPYLMMLRALNLLAFLTEERCTSLGVYPALTTLSDMTHRLYRLSPS